MSLKRIAPFGYASCRRWSPNALGTNPSPTLQPLNSEIFKALYSCFEYGTPLIGYVFTLGTTDTGTIEAPNDEAIKKLVKENVFIHDAALGGFALPHERIAPCEEELG